MPICEAKERVGAGLDALDALDLKIVEILRRDPRSSNRAVAQDAGVAELTAGNRIRALIERGDIRVVGRTDLSIEGEGLVAHVDIHIYPGRLDEVLDALQTRDRLLVVDLVSGPAPLMAIFPARDHADVLAVCERDIGSIAGIERIEINLTIETLVMASAFERA